MATTANKINSCTKIMYCKCSHGYQELKYGKNQRAHNRCVDKSGAPLYRCTVCGNTRGDGK